MSKIDDAAYRMWSVHPNDIDKMEDVIKRCPEDYPGGVRAFYYATEIAQLISEYAVPQAKEAAIGWAVCHSVHRDLCKKTDALYSTRTKDYEKHSNDSSEEYQKISEMLKKYIAM